MECSTIVFEAERALSWMARDGHWSILWRTAILPEYSVVLLLVYGMLQTYSILQVKYNKKQDLLMSMNYSSWFGFSCMLMCMDLNMLFLTAPGAVYSSPFSHTPQIILRSNRIWESTFGFHPTYPSCHIY